jgi:hypothetical protein
MRKLLRFFLSLESQSTIRSDTIFFQHGERRFPDALRMGFNLDITDPSQRRLPFIPLTGGTLYFLPDVLSGGSRPRVPDDLADPLEWIDSEYRDWTTTGTVVIDVGGKQIKDVITTLGYSALLNDAHHFFNRQWYWPLKIPVEFLKHTLVDLNPAEVLNRDGAKVPTGHPRWHAVAVETFLRGGYGLRFGMDDSDAARDDAVNHPFPECLIDTTEDYTELWAALAVTKKSVHDGNVQLMQDIADGITALDPLRHLSTVNPEILSLSPLHPENGMVSAFRTLQGLRPHLEDAGPGLPLADAFFGDSRSYHALRFTLPGNTDEIYYLGVLPTQKIKIFDNASNLLQERRIPTHGHVFVPKTNGLNALRLQLTEGSLKITGKDGTTIPDAQVLDIPLTGDGDTTHITLQPRWPAVSEAEKADSVDRISDICLSLGKHNKTRDAIRILMKKWEDKIRPGSRPAGEIVFRGSRRPWSRVSKADLTGLFNGLHRLSFTGTATLPIRPAEAMTLWIMEGKITATQHKFFTHEISLQDKFKPIFDKPGFFSKTQINNGTEEEIRTLVRVLILWNLWGLDIMNHHSGLGDNTPPLSGNLSAAMASQDNHFVSKGLEAIKTEGIVPPTLDQVNQAITVRKRGRKWFFRAAPNHREIFVWLQYAEYLRRQSRLRKAAANMGVSEALALSPAFSYMAYNGGMEQDLVANGWDEAAKTWKMFTAPDPPDPWETRFFWKWWDRVKTELESHPDDWKDKTIEDVLTKWEISNFANEKNNTYSKPNDRSKGVRVNGLHFAAIVRTYGGIFPSIL